jgi:hypothetical protein
MPVEKEKVISYTTVDMRGCLSFKSVNVKVTVDLLSGKPASDKSQLLHHLIDSALESASPHNKMLIDYNSTQYTCLPSVVAKSVYIKTHNFSAEFPECITFHDTFSEKNLTEVLHAKLKRRTGADFDIRVTFDYFNYENSFVFFSPEKRSSSVYEQSFLAGYAVDVLICDADGNKIDPPTDVTHLLQEINHSVFVSEHDLMYSISNTDCISYRCRGNQFAGSFTGRASPLVLVKSAVYPQFIVQWLANKLAGTSVSGKTVCINMYGIMFSATIAQIYTKDISVSR